jgi:hypothetical protein
MARFPTYERHCLGWRMGLGENWMGMWGVFVKDLPADSDSRIAYLRRHPPAPINWADTVQRALAFSDDNEPDATVVDTLKRQGLIAVDIAWHTWRHGHRDAATLVAESPPQAARYSTRDFWFWCRCIADEGLGVLGELPATWKALATQDAVATTGLEQLAEMFLRGHVETPWSRGLSIDDFTDSFDDDMTFTDAFRLWLMSSFDDREHLDRVVALVPQDWQVFINDAVDL